MSYFEFPHSRTYDNDLGWLIWAMKKLINDWEDFSNTNAIKFADPLTWSIATNYEPSTIVVDADGNGYISRTSVPAGIPLSNDDYWTEIFSFGDITNTIRSNIALNAGSSSTTPSALVQGQLVWWNNNLYEVLYDIAAGTAFIDGVNVQRITVDGKIREIYAAFAQDVADMQENIDAEAQAREDADDTLQANIDAEAQEREDADNTLQALIDEIRNKELKCEIGIDVDTWYNHAVYVAKVEKGILKAIFNESPQVVGTSNTKGDPREFQKYYDFPLLCGNRLTGPYSINGNFTAEEVGEGLYYMAWDRTEEKTIRTTSILSGYNPDTLREMGEDGIAIWGPILENGIEHIYTQSELDKVIVGNNTFGDYVYNGRLSRCFYGIDAEGNLYMCINAGRSTIDQGMTWEEVVRYCAYKEFQNAYMLDGGRSVEMWTGCTRVTPPVNTARHYYTVHVVVDEVEE